jgi:hypothetical protein
VRVNPLRRMSCCSFLQTFTLVAPPRFEFLEGLKPLIAPTPAKGTDSSATPRNPSIAATRYQSCWTYNITISHQSALAPKKKGTLSSCNSLPTLPCVCTFTIPVFPLTRSQLAVFVLCQASPTTSSPFHRALRVCRVLKLFAPPHR